MSRSRFLSRRYIIIFVAIVFCYLVVYGFFGESDNIENDVKIERIERAIKSKENQQACRIPDLPLFSPDISQFLYTEPLINCSAGKPDWVRCEHSMCRVPREILLHKGTLHCKYSEIFRLHEYRLTTGTAHSIIFTNDEQYFELMDSDYAEVKCWTDYSGERWQGIVIGVRRNLGRELPEQPEQKQQRKGKQQQQRRFNVLMYGFDSLSRMAFMRKLPQSYEYLVRQLGGHVLRAYNIIGDGTPQALIPILTGQTELELPETRRRKYGSNYVNVYPMVWQEFARAGYVTAFNEDLPNVGTFTYRLNGFDDQPTDHYMRTYYFGIDPELRKHPHLCFGHRPRHTIMLDYTLQLQAHYPQSPKFIFSFHGELSHDSINLIGVADNDLLAWLRDLQQSRDAELDNTILILMSDHGNRFANVRDTLQGKQEERLPFFSFTFPESFKRQFPREYKHFVANTDCLTTPFDINRTLRHLLELQRGESVPQQQQQHQSGNHSDRARSLFSAISPNRSCADAYIEPHWCSCLQWTAVEVTEPVILAAAQAVIDQINGVTESSRRLCASVRLQTIKRASKLVPQDNLVRFKQSQDTDGFLGQFDESAKASSEMYEVKLVTRPGDAVFEASVTRVLATDQYHVDTAHISRVNKYGDQARCILHEDPELRKFCYCK